MAKFLGCVSDGSGNVFYLNHEQRKEVAGTDIEPDSFRSIIEYYKRKGIIKLNPRKKYGFNKYSYNPFLKKLTVSPLSTAMTDYCIVEDFCHKLDFKTIYPELIIKPIINPFKDRHKISVDKKDINNLKKWIDICKDIADKHEDKATWDFENNICYVTYGVRHIIKEPTSLYYDNIYNFIIDSIMNTVANKTFDSSGASIMDAASAYASSFFTKNGDGNNYSFQCCVDLWESGLVPGRKNNTWRLHGYNGEIVFELKENKLIKFIKKLF